MTKITITPKTLVKHFANEYEAKTGCDYVPVWGRDCKIVKQICEHVEADKVFDAISNYFYLDEETYCLAFFKYKVTDILRKMKRPKKLKNDDSWRYT